MIMVKQQLFHKSFLSLLLQLHLQISLAHAAMRMLEYIPWLRGCFEEPATVEDGYYRVPEAPGAGTTSPESSASAASPDA